MPTYFSRLIPKICIFASLLCAYTTAFGPGVAHVACAVGVHLLLPACDCGPRDGVVSYVWHCPSAPGMRLRLGHHLLSANISQEEPESVLDTADHRQTLSLLSVASSPAFSKPFQNMKTIFNLRVKVRLWARFCLQFVAG